MLKPPVKALRGIVCPPLPLHGQREHLAQRLAHAVGVYPRHPRAGGLGRCCAMVSRDRRHRPRGDLLRCGDRYRARRLWLDVGHADGRVAAFGGADGSGFHQLRMASTPALLAQSVVAVTGDSRPLFALRIVSVTWAGAVLGLLRRNRGIFPSAGAIAGVGNEAGERSAPGGPLMSL